MRERVLLGAAVRDTQHETHNTAVRDTAVRHSQQYKTRHTAVRGTQQYETQQPEYETSSNTTHTAVRDTAVRGRQKYETDISSRQMSVQNRQDY